jgi:eukaryotic-like serine/threonine-protein kinase
MTMPTGSAPDDAAPNDAAPNDSALNDSAAAPRVPGYRHVRTLGRGGYAVVYLFEDEQLGRQVAVKVLTDLDAAVRRQFEDEVRIVAGFDNNPYIVPMIHPGLAPDGRPYFIMPFCPNGSLATAVQAGPLPLDRVVEIGLCIAGALGAVHAKGLVHRDVKPSNILVDEAGRPRLSDFGIAAPLAGTVAPGQAEDFAISVAWSPVEMIKGAHGSQASDLYSLGATLWHLAAGRSPYEVPGGDNTSEALQRRIVAGRLQPLRRDDVPPALRSLLVSLLSTDPGRRPTLADVVTVLNGLGADPRRAKAAAAGGTSAQETDYKPKRPQAPANFPEVDEGWNAAERITGPAAPAGDSRASSAAVRRALISVGVIVVLAAAAVGVRAVLRGSAAAPASSAAADPSGIGATQDPQNPLVPGEQEPPGTPAVTAERTGADTLAFSWTYSAALPGDTFLWRATAGARSGVAKTASVRLADPAGTRMCIEVKVVRADGSDASVDWSPPGCGS